MALVPSTELNNAFGCEVPKGSDKEKNSKRRKQRGSREKGEEEWVARRGAGTVV